MPTPLRLLARISLIASLPLPATADIAVTGVFTAERECEATKRLTSENPGNVVAVIGDSFDVVAVNKQAATHYLIVVPGAPVTERRWVPISCGSVDPPLDLAASTPTLPEPGTVENVLAASWQPGFCATAAGTDKIECLEMTADMPHASRFSIHGLWPDDLDDTRIYPCYCDHGAPVSCRESRPRPDSIDISADTLAALGALMPGVRSDLHLHEWSKHGTCYEDFIEGDDTGSDPDEYFQETMHLTEQLNATGVRALFAERAGGLLAREEIEGAFDEAFGAGAGARVFVVCKRAGGEDVITELWIGLKGDIGPASDLGQLILSAPETGSATNATSCALGRVVAVD